ncbi:MAG: flagellar hook-associated protein FlgL [Deltaproteobacteria bacterium]|nr:flagellar hook-associated protein FlgL [Deltaproteobacteria bacterium]
MRIASVMLYNQLARSLNDNLTDLIEKNNRLASGKKISKPSENVLGTIKAMDYKLSIDRNDQYQTNLSQANTFLDYNDKILGQVSNTLGSLKELIYSGGLSSGTAEDRATYARQAESLRDYLLDLSNSKFNNRYIFSGFQSDQKAYEYDSVNHVYAYQGDSGQLKLPIDNTMVQTINFVGSSPDSSISTTFSYSVPVPETITLSDGSVVTYSAALVQPANATTIQVEITHPDHPGDPDYEDSFTFSNVMDVANLMSQAWQYQDVDGSVLSESKSMNRLQALSHPLDKAGKQLLSVQAESGIRQVHLKDQESRLKSGTLSLQNALTQTEDADMNETAIEITKITTTLEALRMSASNILAQSLFDFLF